MPRLVTPRLTLVPASRDHLVAELEDRPALSRLLAAAVPDSWPPPLYDEDATRWAIANLERDESSRDWGFYYLVLNDPAGRPATLIGAGGFKGRPDAAGLVEIGYSILPEHQRRGYATEAVNAWVDFAFSHAEVKGVVAQTLPSLQASIRVAEKAGFRLTGRGHDPGAGDGEVIRFERSRSQE
jgi:ribosomal-protein-alanine N-acetyltransferase